MDGEFCLKMPDFHVTFRDLLHAINLRHGTEGFTSPPKEGVLRIFFALKNPKASVGFEPANLCTKGQHATSRPQKPLSPSLLVHVPYFLLIITSKLLELEHDAKSIFCLRRKQEKWTQIYYIRLRQCENGLPKLFCVMYLEPCLWVPVIQYCAGDKI